MKKLFTILFLFFLIGCTQDNGLVIYNNIMDYQGFWRDTILFGNEISYEELSVKNDRIEYVISNADNHIIYDTLYGNLILGNENKIRWDFISPLTKTARQTSWSTLNLSATRMKLYSMLQGDHTYYRTAKPLLDEYHISDTQSELLKYKCLLPLTKESIMEKFGVLNALKDNMTISYLVHSPLYNRIGFLSNYDNDSIYSYVLKMKEWNRGKQIIDSMYTKLRNINGRTEYLDGDSLGSANNVIITDSASRQITFVTIKDYDYWPNFSRFIGLSIQNVKNEYRNKYVYKYKVIPETREIEYTYQTSHDGVFKFVNFVADSLGIVTSVAIELLPAILKDADALRKCAEINTFFSRKYYFEKYDEKVCSYHYYSDASRDKSKYKITLLKNYYALGMGYYRIQIIFIKV